MLLFNKCMQLVFNMEIIQVELCKFLMQGKKFRIYAESWKVYYCQVKLVEYGKDLFSSFVLLRLTEGCKYIYL